MCVFVHGVGWMACGGWYIRMYEYMSIVAVHVHVLLHICLYSVKFTACCFRVPVCPSFNSIFEIHLHFA